jgi:hypothetical protein
MISAAPPDRGNRLLLVVMARVLPAININIKIRTNPPSKKPCAADGRFDQIQRSEINLVPRVRVR